MGRTCAVVGCKATRKCGPDVSFFQFPKDEKIRKLWEIFSGRNEFPTIPVICSSHFSPELIYVGEKGRRVLKEDSIPTLRNKQDPSSSDFVHEVNLVVSEERSTYLVQVPGMAVRIHVTFKDTENLLSTKVDTSAGLQKTSKRPVPNDITIPVQSLKKPKLKCPSYSALNEVPAQNTLPATATVTVKKYKRDVKLAENRGRKEVKTQLSKIFTPLQIERMLTNRRLRWTAREIALGICLKSNRKCYEEMVRQKYPLPAISTLKRWTQDIKLQPGILHPIIHILTTEFKDASLFRRQCVVSFDEMAIDSRCMLDTASDKVYGLAKNVQVWMVRGLLEKYKQVFAYGFDENVSGRHFLDMMGTLEHAGLYVRAVVCDLGGKNRGLFKDLGIFVEADSSGVSMCNYIQSPTHGHKIYFFADMPHLIKLMRNNILSHGIVFQTDEGEEASLGAKDFKDLIAAERDNELKCAWKITDAHIDMTNREKMKVKTATQLLSRTVASMFDRNPKQKPLADLVRLINDHFDVHNSMHLNYTEEQKHPFGLRLSLQKSINYKMMEMIQKMRVIGFTKLLPFQNGYLLTSQSLLDLYDDLSKSAMNVSYLLTRRLNQDCLENLFGFIRLMGNNTMPNALEFSRRLKRVLVSRLCFTLVGANNDLDPDKVDFLSIKLLEDLGSWTPEENPEIFLNDDVPEELDMFTEENEENKLESEALERLCGYVAFRLKSKVPTLALENRENVSTDRWTLSSQRGCLVLPSEHWKSAAKILEIEFLKYHSVPKGLNRAPGAVRGFVSALQNKYADVNPLAIEMYVRSRLNIRIASINKKIKQQKYSMASLAEDRIHFLQRYASTYEDEIVPLMSTNDKETNVPMAELQGHLSAFDCDDFPWSPNVKLNASMLLGGNRLSSLQQAGVNATLSGLDVVAVMPTGSGKSAMSSKGFGIVISPLKSIILDQVSQLKSRGVAVFAYDDMMLPLRNTLGSDECNIKLIYVTPEGLASSIALQETMDACYSKSLLSLVAIDEAHCVVDWGKQFRKDYQFLQHLKLKYPTLPVLALTATATEKKIGKIQDALSMKNPIVLRDIAFQPNISYDMMWTKASEKITTVVNLLSNEFMDMAGIIYCRTKKECEHICRVLCQKNLSVDYFHGDIPDVKKRTVLRDSLEGDTKIVVATVAFGLGVHNWNCNFVIHFAPCPNVTQFVQESGRCGRSGLLSYSVILFNTEDFLSLSKTVFLQPNGLADLYEVVRLCIDGSACKQQILRKFLGYPAASSSCHCAICSKKREIKINVTPCLKVLLEIVTVAASSKAKITFAQIANILMGKNRNKIFENIILPVKKHSKHTIEAFLLDSLTRGFIKLCFDFKKLSTACSVEQGPRAILFDKNLMYYTSYNVID